MNSRVANFIGGAVSAVLCMAALIGMVALVGMVRPCSAAVTFGPYDLDNVRVIDGETIEGTVNVWPGVTTNSSIRLKGVDTPEIHAKFICTTLTSPACAVEKTRVDCERALALEAKHFVEVTLQNAKVVVTSITPDKFAGRYDATVLVNGVDLGSLLIASQFGRAYSGGKRGVWCAP